MTRLPDISAWQESGHLCFGLTPSGKRIVVRRRARLRREAGGYRPAEKWLPSQPRAAASGMTDRA